MKPYSTEATGKSPESKHAARRNSGNVYHKTIEKVERAAVRRVGKKRARRANRKVIEGIDE